MVRQAAATAQGLGRAVAPWLLSGLLSGPLHSQVEPGKNAPGPQPAPKTGAPFGEDPRLLDEVMMTVDNKVILLSEVEEEYRAQVESRQRGMWASGTLPQGQPLDLRDRLMIYQQVRFGFLRSAVKAASAWSIQGATPQRIQQIVNKELQRREQEQIKKFGSVNRMRQAQEMGLMSSSEFIRKRREQEDILYQLAEQDFRARFRDRVALMITPKALRDHYERRAPELRTTASAVLAVVRFAVRDPENPAADRDKAARAVAAWRQSRQTGEEVAAEFGGDSLPDRQVTRASAAKLQPFIRTFFAAASAGEVSAPIRHGGAFWVLKILRQTAGEEFRWDDPRVQNMLREELVRQEYEKILLRLERDQEKTLKIWPPLGRRRR